MYEYTLHLYTHTLLTSAARAIIKITGFFPNKQWETRTDKPVLKGTDASITLAHGYSASPIFHNRRFFTRATDIPLCTDNPCSRIYRLPTFLTQQTIFPAHAHSRPQTPLKHQTNLHPRFAGSAKTGREVSGQTPLKHKIYFLGSRATTQHLTFWFGGPGSAIVNLGLSTIFRCIFSGWPCGSLNEDSTHLSI
jgi:hypothetical protein